MTKYILAMLRNCWLRDHPMFLETSMLEILVSRGNISKSRWLYCLVYVERSFLIFIPRVSQNRSE